MSKKPILLSKKKEMEWHRKQLSKFDRYVLYFLLKEHNRIWRKALIKES